MKPLISAVFIGLLLLAGDARAAGEASGTGGKIRIIWQGGEASATLLDNPLSGEFLKLLPLEAEFKDFGGAEKIFYPPEKLSSKGGLSADERQGDFCYYAPWGNIALFYNGFGHGPSLYVLGSLESGKESLAAMKKSFKARIEAIKP